MASPNLKAWRASEKRELTKLCSDNQTSPWGLPNGIISGNRTRRMTKKMRFMTTPVSLFGDDEDRENESPEETPPNDGSKKKKDEEDEDGKFNVTPRGILELQELKDLLSRTVRCPECGCSKVKIEFPNCCLAQYCRMKCTECPWQDDSGFPQGANVELPESAGSPLIERTTDYAVNILFVLAHLASGDGGREAERLLSFLGLPNATTMERNSFSTIEDRIAPAICELNEEILRENTVMEAEAVMKSGEQTNFDLDAFEACRDSFVAYDDMSNLILPEIMVSADMGWQKRSSGRRYDSNSGHAILVGSQTRLPVALCVKSKICKKCDNGKEHDLCFKNHEGSAKAMEPQAVLEMVVGLYESGVVCKTIIADDDSSMKAKLKYSNADHFAVFGVHPTIINSNGEERRRPNKGALPAHVVPQPVFLADPNHRKKTLKNVLYSLEGKPNSTNLTMTKSDVLRIGKNFAFMARTLPDRDEHEYEGCGAAVLEHHFDNHTHCGTWCSRKQLSAAQRTASTKYYRCKTKDAALYDYLKQKIARFITQEALIEVAHGSDTQVNESFNNSVSWIAPKNKTYGGSVSLHNRVCIALGLLSIGTLQYFTRLFDMLGIAMPEATRHSLSVKSNARDTKIAKSKTNEYKTKRMEKEYMKLEEWNLVAAKERRSRDGVAYQSGMGFDGGYTEAEINAPAISRVCKACGQYDHSRVTSSKCPKNEEYRRNRMEKKNATRLEMLRRDALEQEAMDSIPFTDDVSKWVTKEEEEEGVDNDSCDSSRTTALI